MLFAKTSVCALLAAAASIATIADAAEGSLRSRNDRARRLSPTVECTLMTSELLRINPDEFAEDDGESFECMLDSNETGGLANMIYPLDMSKEQRKELREMFRRGTFTPGNTRLNVGGGVWNGVQVKVPPGKLKNKVKKGKNVAEERRRLFSHEGDKPSKSPQVQSLQLAFHEFAVY